MSVLVLCNDPARDPGIGLVGAALAKRGVELLTLRADLFPVDSRLTVPLDGDAPPPGLDGVQSIWLRHADPREKIPAHIPEDIAIAIRQQSLAALYTFVASARVPAFDPPDVLAGAPEKPRQLAIARAVGLRTPRTLLTNDIDALRAFHATCPTGVVAKMVESVRVHAVVDGAEIGGLTRSVRPEDLAEGAALALCPMVFQERVEKVRDLRVTVVGDRVFTAAVAAGDVLDWRGQRALIDGFVATALPDDVTRAVLAYCDRIGVQFAAFDFVEGANGALTFIEANTTSYFHFVERAAGLPISDAVADLLTGARAPRRGAVR